MKQCRERRAVVLVGVLAVMALLVGVMAVLARSTIDLHEFRRSAALERTARLLAESGVAYALAHEEQWRAATPATVVRPDVGAIVPPRIAGKLEITVSRTDAGLTCQVMARVERKGAVITERRSVAL